jgi:hypothetical protein
MISQCTNYVMQFQTTIRGRGSVNPRVIDHAVRVAINSVQIGMHANLVKVLGRQWDCSGDSGNERGGHCECHHCHAEQISCVDIIRLVLLIARHEKCTQRIAHNFLLVGISHRTTEDKPPKVSGLAHSADLRSVSAAVLQCPRSTPPKGHSTTCMAVNPPDGMTPLHRPLATGRGELVKAALAKLALASAKPSSLSSLIIGDMIIFGITSCNPTKDVRFA